MPFKHNKIKRLASRSIEEIKASYIIAKKVSLYGALITFISKIVIQLMNRNGFDESKFIVKLLLKKHKILHTFFEKEFNDFASTYIFTPTLSDDDINMEDKVWFCWWQGIENAPDIIKQCYRSLQRNSCGHEIITITTENYRKYVSIPEWIEKKYKDGIISGTHFSDILRLSLLAQHGGMWLDSTMYCVAPKLNDYFSLPLWTVKHPDYGHVSVGCGSFATYSLHCSFDNRWVFKIILDFILQFWNKNDVLVDYLIFDYIIDYVIRKNEEVAKLFNMVEPNNPRCDDLGKFLGNVYNDVLWGSLSEQTAIFKLTWKQTFPKKIGEEETFYGKLMNGSLYPCI